MLCSEFLWSVFSYIRTRKSKYGYFLHSDKVILSFRLIHFMPLASFYRPWFSDVFKGYRKRTQHEMG